MDEILLNPGYHFIATKVLNCLNFQSLCTLSQTNKKIMKVCESFMITKGRKNFVFENLNCQYCEKVFRNLFKDFIAFVNENEIFHIGYFKSVEAQSRKRDILVQFLEKISKLDRAKIIDIIPKLDSHPCRCGNKLFLACETVKLITQKYVKFIPSNFPTESKQLLMGLLYSALCWEKLDMTKSLLTVLKSVDSCLRLAILALESMKSHSPELMDSRAPFLGKIISLCKNPNAPNDFGSTAMHLVAKLGLDEIAKVLVPYCHNLNEKDQNGKTALDIANEKGHFEIVKLIKFSVSGSKDWWC